jgi:MFS family permease
VAIAVVGALGITYVQDLLPRATGRATALFANTLTTGSLISGILAGATAQALGYRAALLLCGALSAVGCVLLAIARQPRSAADTDLEPSASPALAGQGEASHQHLSWAGWAPLIVALWERLVSEPVDAERVVVVDNGNARRLTGALRSHTESMALPVQHRGRLETRRSAA